jgi:hypothetical protein
MTEWILEGQTVNQKYYLEVLTMLREQVGKKGTELGKNKSWILHQDKAPVQSAFQCSPPPPQSSDLAPL